MDKKILLVFMISVVFFGTLASGYYFLNSDQFKNTFSDKSFGWRFPITKFPLTGKLISYSNIRDPGGIPQGLPVRLKIPIIGVDSTIEDALITPDGRMDVPIGSINVAWFSLGPHPGQVGSAVIGGHFGISNGRPFVFYNLDKLKKNDKVYVVDDKGDTLAFVVRSIKSFDRNADATTVFTSEDGKAHLNLITCEGAWNQVNGTYPQRLVVFTDSVPSEGPVTVTPSLPATAMSPKPDSTAIKPVPTEGPIVPQTLTPEELKAIQTPANNLPSSIRTLTAFVEGFFATPIEGLITSVLLITIGFIAFKIIRRK